MRYIVKYIVVMIAVASLVACSSESYPGIEYDPHMSEDLVNDESSMNANGKVPVNVLIGANSFSISQATRGTGPFTVPDGTDDCCRNRACGRRVIRRCSRNRNLFHLPAGNHDRFQPAGSLG